VELPVTVKIGSGFIFYHADGIVLHPNTVIGRNCSILQQVTIGNTIKSKDRVAIIEDNVNIGAGAKIIGSIHIGSNVAIGANAVVTHDVPDNCSVAGIPARVLNEDNHNLPYHTDYLSFNDWKERKHK
jgi:serine O-acetyltransferase